MSMGHWLPALRHRCVLLDTPLASPRYLLSEDTPASTPSPSLTKSAHLELCIQGKYCAREVRDCELVYTFSSKRSLRPDSS